MRNRIITVILTVGIIIFCPALSFAYTIDGSLADWGVSPNIYGSPLNDWIPNSGIYSEVEDQNGGAGAYLDPGYGGQTFDAEAIYAGWDNTNLYFAVVTGFPPGGSGIYKAGDIAFDFGIDDTTLPYGDSYEYGIETTGNGFTKGGLYSVATWGQGLARWDATYKGNIAAPTEILTINGTRLVQGSLEYVQGFYINGGGTKVYYPGSHYVIEGSILHSYFGGNWGRPFRMHWTQTCGNDFINLDVPIPEPATLSLLGLGLLGLFRLKRKKI